MKINYKVSIWRQVDIELTEERLELLKNKLDEGTTISSIYDEFDGELYEDEFLLETENQSYEIELQDDGEVIHYNNSKKKDVYLDIVSHFISNLYEDNIAEEVLNDNWSNVDIWESFSDWDIEDLKQFINNLYKLY